MSLLLLSLSHPALHFLLSSLICLLFLLSFSLCFYFPCLCFCFLPILFFFFMHLLILLFVPIFTFSVIFYTKFFLCTIALVILSILTILLPDLSDIPFPLFCFSPFSNLSFNSCLTFVFLSFFENFCLLVILFPLLLLSSSPLFFAVCSFCD